MFASTNFQVADATLSFVEGDITKVPADAIVNAANGTVKLSGILAFWRRNRSSVERRINNLGTCRGAD